MCTLQLLRLPAVLLITATPRPLVAYTETMTSYPFGQVCDPDIDSELMHVSFIHEPTKIGSLAHVSPFAEALYTTS